MSREIKYRVKVTWCDEVRIAQVTDMGFGKWIEGAVIGKAFYDLSSYSAEEVDFDTSIGDVLMQYTGSKDKNGVEIYEGDILNVDGRYLAVRALESMFVATENISKDEKWFHSYWQGLQDRAWISRVIGNIYENPELLEANNEN